MKDGRLPHQQVPLLRPSTHNRNVSSISASSEDKSEISNLEQITLVQQGIKIRKNPHTGRLEGVPQEWCDKFNLPFDIDQNKTVATRDLP